MILHLSCSSRPDIAYAVNCKACFIFCPRHSYELAWKWNGGYLKATSSRGLILNLSFNLKIDCYPDANFSGMYGHEKINIHIFCCYSHFYYYCQCRHGFGLHLVLYLQPSLMQISMVMCSKIFDPHNTPIWWGVGFWEGSRAQRGQGLLSDLKPLSTKSCVKMFLLSVHEICLISSVT